MMNPSMFLTVTAGLALLVVSSASFRRDARRAATAARSSAGAAVASGAGPDKGGGRGGEGVGRKGCHGIPDLGSRAAHASSRGGPAVGFGLRKESQCQSRRPIGSCSRIHRRSRCCSMA